MYHRQKYMYLPLLSELEEWEDEFRSFLDREDIVVDEVVIQPEESFDIHLRERIIQAADRNSANNEYP